MRIAQMSDIHIWSRFVPDLMDAALEQNKAFEPHLVAIPGDLTTKGYRDEFEEAKSYLNRLECENVVTVPGNHDGRNVGYYHFEDLFGKRARSREISVPGGFLFRGKLRELRQRTAKVARIQPGEKVLDVGCGTGTLAIEVQQRVGATGCVFGIDPATQQIARARSKAARRNLPIDFRIGVIEHLAFPDLTFDVVLCTLMTHHLPDDLKRQGLSEIARVLKPGGRLVIADFKRKEERQGQAARFHAGGSGIQDLAALVKDAGFSQVETEEMQLPRFTAFPGAGFVRAYKS